MPLAALACRADCARRACAWAAQGNRVNMETILRFICPRVFCAVVEFLIVY